MGEAIENIFAEVVKLLTQLGYVNFDYYYLDGTKVEANANKYSLVWAKSTRTFEKKVKRESEKHNRRD